MTWQDRNIQWMRAVEQAVDGGWTPLWDWSLNVRGFICYLTSLVFTLHSTTTELLFYDGEIMPAVVNYSHRGAIVGYGSRPGSTIAGRCSRLDKPVAFRRRAQHEGS
jgi:hypothetical protein